MAEASAARRLAAGEETPCAERTVVLAVDTATVVTVGLAAGGTYLAGDVVTEPMMHVEHLMPTIRRVAGAGGVGLAEVDEIVVGLGPGPFTGLRVGLVTAQVLAATLPARLHGICSLDVVAAQHATESRPAGDFVVAIDARRRELYWARYAADGARLAGPAVAAPSQLPQLPTVGPGVDLYPQLPAVPGPRGLDPRRLALAGPGLPSAGTTPLYLRRPDATEPTRRKSVLLRRPGRSAPR
jgi:tRNA threonylcarbamoyladenosine biosynthesis protein TsaB